jgi:hypothetical protein
MIHHFSCAHVMSHIVDRLIFDWDDETGSISGPSAERLLSVFREGSVDTHPIPSSHTLASAKNKTDLAAVIGWSHELPSILADHYPQVENADWDGAVYDDDGNIIDYVTF